MNNSSPGATSFNMTLDHVAVAAGFVGGFLFLMPVEELARPFFGEWVLNYIPHGYFNVLSILWLIGLFCLILTAVRFAVMVSGWLISGLLSVIVIKFTLWRHERKH